MTRLDRYDAVALTIAIGLLVFIFWALAVTGGHGDCYRPELDMMTECPVAP